jgi:glycosyltransferase involved in cell wall biosynthesis
MSMSVYSDDVHHLLILEPDARGHAVEWIEHLARRIAEAHLATRLSLAVPLALAKEITGGGHEPWRASVRIVPLRRWQLALCNTRILAVSGLARWWIMRRLLERIDADHGLFLSIDHLTLPLGLGLGFGGRQVSGILFRPSVHYAAAEGVLPRLRERIRDVRKTILYRKTLANPSVRSIRSLDPYFPAYAAAHYPNSEKIRGVPDPAHPCVIQETEDVPYIEEIPAGRTVFALFGVLSLRKGVLALLVALRRLESRYASAIAVCIAGEIEPAIARKMKDALGELADLRPELWLRVENRRLSTAEIAALVDRADVILAPYQRFVGSSGVLLWAAKGGKPVITQNYGLLGRLVGDYGLGLAVDTSDPSDIAAALAATVRRGPATLGNPEGMARFIDSRTCDGFADAVLEGLRAAPPPRPTVVAGVDEITATD